MHDDEGDEREQAQEMEAACPWGSETPIQSRGEAVILVDEPCEQIPPPDIARVDRDRLPGRCER